MGPSGLVYEVTNHHVREIISHPSQHGRGGHVSLQKCALRQEGLLAQSPTPFTGRRPQSEKIMQKLKNTATELPESIRVSVTEKVGLYTLPNISQVM